ncbi:MAG: dethiobiotin synthase, partial [Eubacterium sp.]
MTKGIFIVATGTDVGKTYIAAELIKVLKTNGINAGYYKCALSGAEEKEGRWIAGDAAYVFKQADLTGDPNAAVTTILKYPASPHLSARLENKCITLAPILDDYHKACERYSFVVVEGSGGIICPLNLEDEYFMLTDVIKALQLDVFLVGDAGLGAINDVLLTVA